MKRLRNSFKKFYGRYPDLIGKYQRSVKDMMDDSFPQSVSCSGTIDFQSFFFSRFCRLECHFLPFDADCDRRQTTRTESGAP